MSKMWDKIKKSMTASFPSYEHPHAQSLRNLMIFAVYAELFVFIPFAVLISFSNMSYWNTRAWAYASLGFVLVTGLFGILICNSIEAASDVEELALQKAKIGRIVTLFLLAMYVAIIALETVLFI